MSGAPATATVSAGPPGPAAPIAPSNTVAPDAEAAGDPGSFQSFTEVLSAQRAESGHEPGERHDTGDKKGPSHGAKEAQANPGSPPSPDLPAAGPLPAAGISGLTDAAAGAAGPSNPAPDAGTAVPDAAGDAEPGPPAPLSALTASTASVETAASDVTTASVETAASDATESAATEAASSEAGAPAARAEVVSGAGSGAHVDEPAGGSASTAVATTDLVGLKPGSSPAAVVASPHGGAGTEPAVGHGSQASAEVASAPGPASTSTPVPHPNNQSTLAPTDALRAVTSVPRPGEPAAPSTQSVAAPGAGALDVEGLSGSISRPLSDGNGTYTVTVALHPPELGHLQAVVSLEGNDLQVSLTAQTQTGHDALANATDALKDQLARGGVNVNVTLRDPGSQSGGEERYRPPTTSGDGSFVTGGTTAETTLSSGLVSGQIHLVL